VNEKIMSARRYSNAHWLRLVLAHDPFEIDVHRMCFVVVGDVEFLERIYFLGSLKNKT